MSQNPLHKFYRQVKLYTTLPSGTSYYNNDVITFNDSNEVGVMPMTAKDEITVKNPDALLNGEALAQVIASCVPGVKQPKKLLSNDIDALLIAIRHATYGDELEITTNCPKCEKENVFGLNITQTLASMDKLESEYTIALENGITFYVRPFSYNETISALQTQFEQHKAARELTDKDISEARRLKMFSESFDKFVDQNANLIAKCILKITQNSEDLTVTEFTHIKDFLQNIDRATFSEIDKLIQTINSTGVPSEFDAECSSCGHKWKAGINFNPVGFFTES